MSNSPGHNHLVDCSELSATDLRRHYRAEANTHRNMLQRAASQGRIIHPAFQVFRDFLAHVGPRPCRGATLDRINNSDPEYAPGKVRWADKRTQNSNKGDTLVFYYSRTGDTYTTSRLAALRKVSPGTIRKRRERGWSDDEIIEGKRSGAAPVIDPKTLSWQGPHQKDAQPLIQRPLTPEERQFLGKAASVAREREESGEEPSFPSYEDINADCLKHCYKPANPLIYEKKFAEWWTEYKPHLRRERLADWAQELIAKLEPEDTARWLAEREQITYLRDQL